MFIRFHKLIKYNMVFLRDDYGNNKKGKEPSLVKYRVYNLLNYNITFKYIVINSKYYTF